MFIRQIGDRLSILDDLFMADQVWFVPVERKVAAFVFKRERLLWHIGIPLQPQFNFHALLINRFEKSAALLAIDFEACADNLVAFFFVQNFVLMRSGFANHFTPPLRRFCF